ncbi:hypothetical protein CYMTET_21227 [Cymbomonas tetramitiformis]|uniref:Tubulin/FtsZ GTPase domain-containing protein n=1 Tax=Cymbomonas tetramitiformis TaxID=36881 RepID=A0AAE0L333_9CHLO|nr:hypothetical protein CYMTET_21227 [Cymbomonas tetramitiformis]
MSTVVVQVGQCGNSIGAELWQNVADEIQARGGSDAVIGAGLGDLGALVDESENNPKQPLQARCVLVDTEPKVIRLAQDVRCAGGLLKGAAAAVGQSGRGNNWAHGYRQPGECAGGSDPAGEACLPILCLTQHCKGVGASLCAVVTRV